MYNIHSGIGSRTEKAPPSPARYTSLGISERETDMNGKIEVSKEWEEKFYFIIEWVKKYGGTYEIVDDGQSVKFIFHNTPAPENEFRIISEFLSMIPGMCFTQERS
jgi:hypothetical protein